MSSILALDIGEKRVGVAIADSPVFIAHPLMTINADELQAQISRLIKERDIVTIVSGYPRNQSGEATAQTEVIEKVVEGLEIPDGVTLVWQDESLTSVKAEEELTGRGKPFEPGDIDALAATFILEDYLKDQT